MPDPEQVEAPEEAVEVAIATAKEVHGQGFGPANIGVAVLRKVAPAIRFQERQRVREALEDDAVRKAATEAVGRERNGDGPGCGCDQCVALDAVRAAFGALDTLEDPRLEVILGVRHPR